MAVNPMKLFTPFIGFAKKSGMCASLRLLYVACTL